MHKLIAIDETRHFREDLQAIGGRIWGRYLYDTDKAVFCCELTPSAELSLVDYVSEKGPDTEKESEEFQDNLNQARTCSDDVAYYHFSDIGRMLKSGMAKEQDIGPSLADNEENQDALEQEFDHLQGNVYLP